MGKSIVCPICGQSFIGLKKHYEVHKTELSFSEFFAKVYKYPRVPKCPHCGNECSINWGSKKFNKTCGSTECTNKQFSESRAALWQDAEFKSKQHDSRVEAWKDPQKRENRIESLKKANSRPEVIEKIKNTKLSKRSQENSEYSNKASKRSKDMWNKPGYRENHSKKLKATLAKPEHKERMSQKFKNMWKDPEYRAKISEARKKQWQNPEFREMMSKKSSERMTKNLRSRQIDSDRPAMLYIIGFLDTKTNTYCVKVGITVENWSRFHSYMDMGYKFCKGYMIISSLGRVKQLEDLIHNGDFQRYKMDNRKSRFLNNGYTEWYAANQLYLIRDKLSELPDVKIREMKQSDFSELIDLSQYNI